MSSNFGLFHIAKRKRRAKSESFPHPGFWKGTLDRSMYVIGSFGPLALIPQIADILNTHNVSSLSLTTWVTLGIINLFWTLYGIVHKDGPILAASVASGALQLTIVSLILTYR